MAVLALLLAAGCGSGAAGVPGRDISSFPTATLHPMFSSRFEFEEHLTETRTTEAPDIEVAPTAATTLPEVNASPTVQFLPTDTPQPAAGESTPTISGPIINVPILLYHHIGPPAGGGSAPDYEFYVSVDHFREQMAFLANNGYTPVDLYSLYNSLIGTAELPPDPVIITFDDGYLDLYENAFPILQEFGFMATAFVITDFVENGRDGYLTWTMIEEMAAAGLRFETHSRTQADLRGQTGDYLIWQVLDSQEMLARHLGYTPRFIAYPFGQYDDNLVRFLEGYDFWGGLTAQAGLQAGRANRFTWPRLHVPAGTAITAFANLVASGQPVNYQPATNVGGSATAPLTVTLEAAQGVVTVPALLLFDEVLNPDWTVRTSPGVRFSLQDSLEAHSGSIALAIRPEEDLGSFFLQVRPDTTAPYLRDEVLGIAFWLFTGDEPLAPDDLALAITGSNDLAYWSAVDESIDADDFEPSFDDARYDLGFNQVISATTWVQVVLFFADLDYNTDYQYITGIHIVNNFGVNRSFLIDELVLIRQPQ